MRTHNSKAGKAKPEGVRVRKLPEGRPVVRKPNRSLTPAEFRKAAAAHIPEAELQSSVIKMATLFGWMHYHTHDSRRSPKGFPDLVLVRGQRLIFAELKRQNGHYRVGQKEWLAALDKVAEVHTWRPMDYLDGTIEAILR
jgi:hypothetical protein